MNKYLIALFFCFYAAFSVAHEVKPEVGMLVIKSNTSDRYLYGDLGQFKIVNGVYRFCLESKERIGAKTICTRYGTPQQYIEQTQNNDELLFTRMSFSTSKWAVYQVAASHYITLHYTYK